MCGEPGCRLTWGRPRLSSPSWASRPRDGDTPYTTRVFARWRLTQAGVDYLERVRDGGNVAVYVTPEVVLLNHGESLPGLYPRLEGVHRPNVNPHSPIWQLGHEHLDVSAETWAREILTPWQQAAVTLVVKLRGRAVTATAALTSAAIPSASSSARSLSSAPSRASPTPASAGSDCSICQC
jgi:hypothetical protein